MIESSYCFKDFHHEEVLPLYEDNTGIFAEMCRILYDSETPMSPEDFITKGKIECSISTIRKFLNVASERDMAFLVDIIEDRRYFIGPKYKDNFGSIKVIDDGKGFISLSRYIKLNRKSFNRTYLEIREALREKITELKIQRYVYTNKCTHSILYKEEDLDKCSKIIKESDMDTILEPTEVVKTISPKKRGRRSLEDSLKMILDIYKETKEPLSVEQVYDIIKKRGIAKLKKGSVCNYISKLYNNKSLKITKVSIGRWSSFSTPYYSISSSDTKELNIVKCDPSYLCRYNKQKDFLIERGVKEEEVEDILKYAEDFSDRYTISKLKAPVKAYTEDELLKALSSYREEKQSIKEEVISIGDTSIDLEEDSSDSNRIKCMKKEIKRLREANTQLVSSNEILIKMVDKLQGK